MKSLNTPRAALQDTRYNLVSEAIDFLLQHRATQPDMAALAQHVKTSESHLQRLFSEWTGLSPKQFLSYLNQREAKARLRELPVLESALACGLSGSGRLHDLMIQAEGVTPGEYRSHGAGLEINYGDSATAYGSALLAWTQRGLCKLAFYDSEAERARLLDELHSDWTAATIRADQESAKEWANQIFTAAPTAMPLRLLLRGTPFQLKVWEALMRIPSGTLCSYQGVACALGQAQASRAVAAAIARNRIAILVPCHRVIRSSGILNEYRWGRARKAMLIAQEAERAR